VKAPKRVLLSLFLWALAAALTAAPAAAEERRYTLSVVPQFPAVEIHRSWSPVAERLQRETGLRLELKTHAGIPAFEEDFLQGRSDFAYMNPYHAVMARRAQGYVPLVRDGSRQLAGILLVRQDSPYKSVKDLDGSELAFPAPNAFGASLYMRALLSEEERIRFRPNYVSTHTNVMRHVLLGQAAAGGAVGATFAKEPPEVRGLLRVLYETPGVEPHPLAAHPRVPAKDREAVVAALLQLGQDAAAAPMLQAIQMPRPVRADYGRDYRPLERLKLEKYVQPPE
jgi:phosphonate transport system substrate-binding protein